ncbi:MAG TPA: RdgB/HAM1 family non-canonical purine NTP pyrophosphatase [Acidimicrobiia bacterium]|nr:RdgB/HAM1 family non-canonical purine NTP pyrophosphatase [Acidimicrobiia bacterium]
MLATANEHKAREIEQILHALDVPVELVARPTDVPDVDETGATLEENARLKAVALCDATGEPVLADDTGLEVDALDGAPGVHSARFASPGPGARPDAERNTDKLLALLEDVPDDRRTARFVTVAIARFPDGREAAAIGTVEGRITRERRTSPTGEGFGYDPVFEPEEGRGLTFAEMSGSSKHEISHRGRAFRTLADGLRIMAALDETHEGE